MSTSAAKLAANQSNAQHSTGPRTETGKAASAQNARKHGLFSAKDYIRAGEQSDYDELDQSLRAELIPEGRLEHHLVDEIRRAMWRLRRCGEVEASMVETCAAAGVVDPMQNEPTASTQLAVDRARAQCHRLLNRCVAELRKLQTERNFRLDYFEGKSCPQYGVADLRAISKGIGEKATTTLLSGKVATQMVAAQLERTMRGDYDQMLTEQTQTPRNAHCPCGSGLKYKRCCGPNAAPVLHQAA